MRPSAKLLVSSFLSSSTKWSSAVVKTYFLTNPVAKSCHDSCKKWQVEGPKPHCSHNVPVSLYIKYERTTKNRNKIKRKERSFYFEKNVARNSKWKKWHTSFQSVCEACVYKTYKGVLGGVLFRDGEVVVDEFGAVRLQLDGGPHHWVEVGKIVVHVDAFVAVTTQGPTWQFWALWIKESGIRSLLLCYGR